MLTNATHITDVTGTKTDRIARTLPMPLKHVRVKRTVRKEPNTVDIVDLHTTTSSSLTPTTTKTTTTTDVGQLVSRELANSPAQSARDTVDIRSTGGRPDFLSWDEYFMSIAFLSAQRSKDPSTQVGACVVDHDNRIVAVGYNGFPRGCGDGSLPWARESESQLDTKYPYVVHAEANAILNRNTATLRDCKMYVALFPCNECTKLILQSGITEIVYFSDKYHDTVAMTASRRMLEIAGVIVRQFIPTRESLTIRFAL